MHDKMTTFWKQSTTWIVVILRLIIVVVIFVGFPYHHDGGAYLSSSSLAWIGSKPTWTSSTVREAMAIQSLSGGGSQFLLEPIYRAVNPIIRLPPWILYIAMMGTKLGPSLWMVFALGMDLLIALLLEQIGRRLLSSSILEATEERLQAQLPDILQPPHGDLFPIYSTTRISQDVGGQQEDVKAAKTNTEPNHNRTLESDLPGTTSSSSSWISLESLPLLAAQIYFLSPVTMLLPISATISLQALPFLSVLLSLYTCISPGGSYWTSTWFLAMAVSMEVYWVVLLIPLVLLREQQHQRSNNNRIQDDPSATTSTSATSEPRYMWVVSFVLWYVALQLLSYQLVTTSTPTRNDESTGWAYYRQVWWNVYGCGGWTNLSPSLSVQWYFAMQIFARFRPYFEILLFGLPYLVVLPMTIRLHAYPMELFALLTLSGVIFRSTQTLFDANTALCLFLFCPKSLARMGKASVVALISIWVPVVLNVVDHWMWLGGPNTGNPNYMFFQCMAYNVFLAILLVQFLSASLQRDKALRLYAKERENKHDEQSKGETLLDDNTEDRHLLPSRTTTTAGQEKVD